MWFARFYSRCFKVIIQIPLYGQGGFSAFSVYGIINKKYCTKCMVFTIIKIVPKGAATFFNNFIRKEELLCISIWQKSSREKISQSVFSGLKQELRTGKSS